MPDPRRTLIALLGACAFLVVSPVAASASSGANEYTESVPGATGPVPTNDIVNGGGDGDGSSSGSTSSGNSSSAGSGEGAVLTPTRADQALAKKGAAGQALLNVIGTTRSADPLAGSGGSEAGVQTVGARLLDGSGDSGGMGFLLYALIGTTLLWAMATAVGRKRQAVSFS